jgi:hypothetical protein
MLTKPETKGPGKNVRFKRRKQKRNPRRLVESVGQDWEKWDQAAELEGVNWSEFCRRALNWRADQLLGRPTTPRPPTVEKPGLKKSSPPAV